MNRTTNRIKKTTKAAQEIKQRVQFVDVPYIPVAFVGYQNGVYTYGERKIPEAEFEAFQREPQFTKTGTFIIDDIPRTEPPKPSKFFPTVRDYIPEPFIPEGWETIPELLV